MPTHAPGIRPGRAGGYLIMEEGGGSGDGKWGKGVVGGGVRCEIMVGRVKGRK